MIVFDRILLILITIVRTTELANWLDELKDHIVHARLIRRSENQNMTIWAT